MLRPLLIAAVALTLAVTGQAASLCKPDERVVFACTAKPKRVSACASGNLSRPEGRLIYRFGRDAAHVELEHGADKPPREAGFRFGYDGWAKGASSRLMFTRGGFRYVVEHAAGVFGVDGGDNYAQVQVWRGDQLLATVRCDEPSAQDHLYEVLQPLGLPAE